MVTRRSLSPGDREVVHLAVRHDLSSADIGAALGLPANHAHARLSRARSQLERALGALLVARSGARDCPALADLVAGWQGRLTPTLRKRVAPARRRLSAVRTAPAGPAESGGAAVGLHGAGVPRRRRRDVVEPDHLRDGRDRHRCGLLRGHGGGRRHRRRDGSADGP
ncbi:RNA polymerase sigma factor [Micromonospora craniellae]|uniref:RNA polymerase sigma factor n=1 Tax=Micromonospora craniellae TaxID=2294034 RepID=UPI001CC56DEA|nr:sigma factor-like helix-turn-helix DNA-binding protein [Micromonospora craniellae]